MKKQHDVISVCNALVDLLYEVSDNDIVQHNLNKGTMQLVDRATQEALQQEFAGHQKAIELGGSCLNAIRAMAMLGNKSAFVGMIGADAFGKSIEQRFETLKIAGHLHRNTGKETTGTCMVFVTPDGERTMATYLGASRLYGEEHIPVEGIKASKIFHFCGYQWDTPGQKAAIKIAVSGAKQSGTLVSFDLADPFVVRGHAVDFAELISQADIVFANEEEARLLYGLKPEQTAAKIAASGAIAVIKLGARGALIQKGERSLHVQPVPTTVVDTTAAGDMFAAGFLHGMVRERPLDECGRVAALLASDVISRYGASLSDKVIAEVARLCP